ncbi:MAG: winged helix-turn-helix transcriptional regulator [Actinobacteria bacterium]|nr:winged helix-turn-helix transcriptional regulator [Actinomycetota bacterium]
MNVMPAEPQPSPRPVSPLAEAVGRVGDRWALLLVHALLSGPRRFNDLQEDLDGIAPNVQPGVLGGPPSSRAHPGATYQRPPPEPSVRALRRTAGAVVGQLELVRFGVERSLRRAVGAEDFVPDRLFPSVRERPHLVNDALFLSFLFGLLLGLVQCDTLPSTSSCTHGDR